MILNQFYRGLDELPNDAHLVVGELVQQLRQASAALSALNVSRPYRLAVGSAADAMDEFADELVGRYDDE